LSGSQREWYETAVTAAPLRAHELPVLGEVDAEEAERADLVGLQLSGSLPPLFLIRTWAGEVAKHRRLAQHLGPEQPIYSFAPPRGTRLEDFPKDAQEWSEQMLARVLEVPHPGPYRIGGWSFGGVIALEVAERLVQSGRAVELLVLIDTRLPKQWPVRRRGTKRRSALHKSVKRLDKFLELSNRRERLAYLGRRVARRGEKLMSRVTRLRERLERRGEPVPQLPASEQGGHVTMTGHRMSQLQRAIWVAYLKYRASGSSLRVVQLRTAESQEAAKEVNLGWGPWLNGDVESALLPGDHSTIFDEPHVAVLGARLSEALARVPDQPAH
jgi:thioesterase domain-containing protein